MTDPECKYVLLVEDDEDLRTQMASILEDEGYRVQCAPNGLVALEYLKECATGDWPGCIVLDLMMPIMNGAEFVQLLNRDYTDSLAKIPIIIATAKGSAGGDLLGIPANLGRIRKPMEIEEFIDSVMKHCGKPVR